MTSHPASLCPLPFLQSPARSVVGVCTRVWFVQHPSSPSASKLHEGRGPVQSCISGPVTTAALHLLLRQPCMSERMGRVSLARRVHRVGPAAWFSCVCPTEPSLGQACRHARPLCGLTGSGPPLIRGPDPPVFGSVLEKTRASGWGQGPPLTQELVWQEFPEPTANGCRCRGRVAGGGDLGSQVCGRRWLVSGLCQGRRRPAWTSA